MRKENFHMKRLVLFIILMLTGLYVSAQDIITLKKGKELQVKVLKVTPSYIEYSYPNEDAVIQIQRRKVSSIHYESGRVEEFEKPKTKEDTPETGSKEQKIKENKISVRKEKVQEQLFVKNPLEKKQMFYTKLGLSLNMIHFYDNNLLNSGLTFKTGEAFDFGYSHYIKDSKFYWAAEFGLTTRSVRSEIYIDGYDENLVITRPWIVHHGFKFSPVNFGYRFMLPREFAIDLRLGGYFACYYSGKMFADVTDEETYYYKWNGNSNDGFYSAAFNKQRRFNAGFETGIAFWYKRFCFDFTYNAGFVSFVKTAFPTKGMSWSNYYDALDHNPNSLDWRVEHKNYNYNIQFKLGIAF